MKRTLLLLFALCFCTALSAQNKHHALSDANVIGHVVDAVSHEHLPGMTIQIKGTTFGTTTDGTGHYFLKMADDPESITYPLLYKYLAAQDCYQIYSNLTPDAGIVIDTCWAKVDWEHNLLWCYGDKDLKDQDPDFCRRIK